MFVPRRSNWIPSPYHPHHRSARARAAPPSPPPMPSKVISIPVHFVGSEEWPVKKAAASVDPGAAALTVQKVARGFLVRKNVRVVRGVEAEVEEIERRVEEARELIGREEKERVRVSEMLMGVLFRLDAVRGVRDYRRKVVRRVVSLQEALDSIANGDSRVEADGEEEEEQSKGGTAETGGGASSAESCILDEENPDTDTKIGALEEKPIAEHKKEDAMEETQREEVIADGAGEDLKEAVEESQRMSVLVVELLEKNAEQIRVICGLSRRVEDLERKVARMGKKKRRRLAMAKAAGAKKCNRKL